MEGGGWGNDFACWRFYFSQGMEISLNFQILLNLRKIG
jgi:hypothetical protein